MKRSLNCVRYKASTASGCFVSFHENKVGIVTRPYSWSNDLCGTESLKVLRLAVNYITYQVEWQKCSILPILQTL
jgi:hypothetical protein